MSSWRAFAERSLSVDPGLGHGLEEVVGMDEGEDLSCSDRGVHECLSEEALANADLSEAGNSTKVIFRSRIRLWRLHTCRNRRLQRRVPREWWCC